MNLLYTNENFPIEIRSSVINKSLKYLDRPIHESCFVNSINASFLNEK